MKVSLAVLLTVIAGVSVADEVPSSPESETRELSGHQYYPAYQPTRYYPVYRTPYPTHKPPTPYPTGRKPSPYPTPNPTPKPTPYPTPYPIKRDPYPAYPPPRKTPRPTRYPTKNPTPEPTPYPTKHPTPYPTRHPTYEPSPEPSPEPSEEPSESPTNSEEPSESPTSSEEPSETPTGSEEPSESPTISELPSESPSTNVNTLVDPTTYDIICDIRFNVNLGLLCDFVQLNPDIAVLLGAPVSVVSLLDPSVILSRATRTIESSRGRDLQQEVVVNGGLVGTVHQRERFFHSEFQNSLSHINLAQPKQVTLFAPTNYAFLTLPNGILARLLLPGGESALNNLLRFHVANGKIGLVELECDSDLQMINGDKTTTRCNNGFVYQVGAGNEDPRQPQIEIPNAGAKNGFIHVVDEVILPEEVFSTSTPLPTPAPVSTTTVPTRTFSPTNTFAPSDTFAPSTFFPTTFFPTQGPTKTFEPTNTFAPSDTFAPTT